MHQKFCAHLGKRVALVEEELPAGFLLEAGLRSLKLLFESRRGLGLGLELGLVSHWSLRQGVRFHRSDDVKVVLEGDVLLNLRLAKLGLSLS